MHHFPELQWLLFLFSQLSVAGLDIKVSVILKQHKVYGEYLNLPNLLSGTGILQCTPEEHTVLSSVGHLLDYVHDRKCLLTPPYWL